MNRVEERQCDCTGIGQRVTDTGRLSGVQHAFILVAFTPQICRFRPGFHVSHCLMFVV